VYILFVDTGQEIAVSKKIALITGITGQDGSYLAEHLLGRGYEVHGVMRRASTITTERIDHLFDPEARDRLHYGDLQGGLDALIYKIKPDCIFNIAAQSHVMVSFKEPVLTAKVNAVGVIDLLETIRQAEQTLGKQIRFYQASSSEMFGKTPPPHSENSYFHPASPYGCAKLFSYWATRTYRDSYGMFAANGILFNHESPRRGKNFVTKKITRAAARIALGLQKRIELGNLDAKRDWGHSKDYTKAMVMILEHEKPDDWVVSSGQYYSVREFAEIVFKHFGLNFYDYFLENEALKRPSEVPALLGDSTKIRTVLGWQPEYSFEALVKEMCDYDYETEKRLMEQRS
jgi:GDPmannose 4,6-dehydratase